MEYVEVKLRIAREEKTVSDMIQSFNPTDGFKHLVSRYVSGDDPEFTRR